VDREDPRHKIKTTEIFQRKGLSREGLNRNNNIFNNGLEFEG
jgi:hypothetical protein